MATFGSLQDLVELEPWAMRSPVLRCKQCLSLGSWRSWHWQSTWGWWGQLGFPRAEAFQLWCLQTPHWGAGGTEMLSCARESKGEHS